MHDQTQTQRDIDRILRGAFGLYAVAAGHLPTADDVAILHMTCIRLIMTGPRIPKSLAALADCWLLIATRTLGHPAPEDIASESGALARALLAYVSAPHLPITVSIIGPHSKSIRIAAKFARADLEALRKSC